MPALVRITCRMIHRYLSLRFSSKNSTYVIADFVINFWLAASMDMDILSEASRLYPFLLRNVEEVKLVIKKIVRDNSKDIGDGFIRQFHLLVTNLKVSIANYIHEVINIDSKRIDDICL